MNGPLLGLKQHFHLRSQVEATSCVSQRQFCLQIYAQKNLGSPSSPALQTKPKKM